MLQAQARSGSLHLKYKRTYSIILLTVLDVQYNFIAVDVGAYGKQSDCSVFAKSVYGQKMSDNKLDLPRPQSSWKSCRGYLHVFVADETFPIEQNLLRPFPGKALSIQHRIFHCRLSKGARIIVENAFGIMVSRFCVFRRPLLVKPQTAANIVQASVVST